MTPSLGWMELLEQLIELKKPIYSLTYQFITKDIKDMNQQLDEEIHRASYMGRDTDLLCSLQACCPPSISTAWTWGHGRGGQSGQEARAPGTHSQLGSWE